MTYPEYIMEIAKDVLHMKRIERGCYYDIIQAQKRFGRLTLEQIKKLLQSDFDKCWPSIELVLSHDNDMYFISSLEQVMEKQKAFAKSRSVNRKKKPVTVPAPVIIVPEEINEAMAIKTPLIQQMYNEWEVYTPEYPFDKEADFPALLDFARFICRQLKTKFEPADALCIEIVLNRWRLMVMVVMETNAWQKKSLRNLAKFNMQEIYNRINKGPTPKKMII